MERAQVMTMRIREQITRVCDLQNKGTLTITTAPVEPATLSTSPAAGKNVEALADHVTEMIMTSLQASPIKTGGNSGN